MENFGNIQPPLPTAPELVLDLLVADGGTLTAAALCRAGALFALEPAVVRVALTRLVAQGKVGRSGRGRYAIERGRHALTEVVDGWWLRQREQLDWDGGWVAVIDGDVRRQDKTTWRRHQRALQLRGFALLSPGLWLRPDNLVGGVPHEGERLQALGLAPQAVVAGLHALQGPALPRARSLWDGQRLPDHYRALAAQLERSARRLPQMDLAQATQESLQLGRHVIACLLRDPLLPAALSDPRPRERLVGLMRAYQQQARAVCRAFLAQGEPRSRDRGHDAVSPP